MVRDVQWIPSVLVAATVDAPPGPPATATKVLLPQVTEVQYRLLGSVQVFQVVPSVEYDATLLLYATATQVPLP
jgi:hypothetical protein